MARFVERELRAYLACGELAHGFVRVHCDACGRDRLVAFSCKGRGFCPSCGGRRMADTAAQLVDRVLPAVPVRQWVLTLPYPLRYRCAWDARLTSAVLRAFLRAVFADLRRRARQHHGVRRGQCGAVTFLQRFGSALNLTPHFHSLVLDGVYAGPAHNPGPFLPLPPPETADVAHVMAGAARRIARLLERRGLDAEDDPLAADDPLLATLTAASICSRIASGPDAGRPWRRLGDRVEPVAGGEDDPAACDTVSPRCVRHGGMSLHADVAVPARDRRRLERLCRYAARPPLALARLEALPDGRLAYRLKTRWRDGTTHVVMERRELLERLAPLVPAPRAHQVRYHGVLAPCASGRDRVVPGGAERPDDSHPAPGAKPASRAPEPVQHGGAASQRASGRWPAANALDPTSGSPLAGDASPCLPAPAQPRPQPRRYPWADLLQRVFEIDALRCPDCGARMRILSVITEPRVARGILECLQLLARAPPLAPAATSELVFDATEDAWLGAAEAFDLDPSPADEWQDSG